MTPGQKLVSKLVLCLLGGFLISELLTRVVFYPTIPLVRFSFRSWLAQKKQQVAALPERVADKLDPSRLKLPPPIFFEPSSSPLPPKTLSPGQTPFPGPTFSPSPTPRPPFSPSPTPRPPFSPSPTSTPTLTPSPTPPPPDPGDQAQGLVRAVNEERGRQGLHSLDAPALLMQAAQMYIEDLADIGKCGHEVPGKGFIWDYAARLGYQGTPVCEVIACHAQTPERAVQMWMGDGPHQGCVLDSSARVIGAGMTGNVWLAGFLK